jgi:hypothetical protein
MFECFYFVSWVFNLIFSKQLVILTLLFLDLIMTLNAVGRLDSNPWSRIQYWSVISTLLLLLTEAIQTDSPSVVKGFAHVSLFVVEESSLVGLTGAILSWKFADLKPIMHSKGFYKFGIRTFGRMSLCWHVRETSFGQNVGTSNVTVNWGNGC